MLLSIDRSKTTIYDDKGYEYKVIASAIYHNEYLTRICLDSVKIENADEEYKGYDKEEIIKEIEKNFHLIDWHSISEYRNFNE